MTLQQIRSSGCGRRPRLPLTASGNPSYPLSSPPITKSQWYGTNRRDYGDPAGTARDAKLESWIFLLSQHGINIEYTTRYKTQEERVDCANNVLPYVRACESQTPKFVEMCENWKYPIGKDGKKVPGAKPLHDEFSHPGTAFYYMTCVRFGKKGGDVIV